MNASAENTYPLNWLRWLVVAAIVAGGIVANSIYGDFPVLYRVAALLVLAVVALLVAVTTREGSATWVVIKEARTELRKVVWPTNQETHQTTLIVIVLTVIMAIILWLLDSLFGYLASLIIG